MRIVNSCLPSTMGSSASGGSDTVPLLIVSRRRATGSSRSPVCRLASGAACEPRTQLSNCTRSSSAGSRRKPCCLPPTLLPCCSGRCLHLVRSTCARLMVGRHWPRSLSNNRLTSQPDQLASTCRRSRRANSNHIRDDTWLGGIMVTAFVTLLRFFVGG